MKPNENWKVLPHGPLTRVSDNLYTVEGMLKMPLGESTRRMTVVRLSGGRLAIYSAIALNESEMQKVEALGRPTYLIVPSDIHRLDVKAWTKRYPEAIVVAPRGARSKVNEIVTVDSSDTSLDDPRAELIVLPGTNEQELAMLVDTGSNTGKTLVVNDLIFNFPVIKGMPGLMLRLFGFGPGKPTMPKIVMMKLVKDKGAVREQLQRWATEDLERILVSHGMPIEKPRETLLQLARGLS